MRFGSLSLVPRVRLSLKPSQGSAERKGHKMARSSAIPHVDEWLTEALPGYCVLWHFVLAGKCDVALTTSEIHDVELAAVC